MKMLITLASLPLLVLAACAPAQEQDKPKQEPKTEAPATKPAKDDKITAADPAIKAIDAFIAKMKVDTKKPEWRLGLSEPPKQTFSTDHDYLWHVVTSEGPLVIRYMPDVAPMHVSSGIYLARLGFYDDIVFHRIITKFMAQGGDPLGRGNGGPGYYMDGEFKSSLKHDRPGLLSMANTGQPKSDGSQFFLTFVPTPWLDGKHTIWGEVVEGMETVKKLEKLGSQSGKPSRTPKIVQSWITVVEKAKPEAKDGEKKDAEKKDGDK